MAHAAARDGDPGGGRGLRPAFDAGPPDAPPRRASTSADATVPLHARGRSSRIKSDGGALAGTSRHAPSASASPVSSGGDGGPFGVVPDGAGSGGGTDETGFGVAGPGEKVSPKPAAPRRSGHRSSPRRPLPQTVEPPHRPSRRRRRCTRAEAGARPIGRSKPPDAGRGSDRAATRAIAHRAAPGAAPSAPAGDRSAGNRSAAERVGRATGSTCSRRLGPCRATGEAWLTPSRAGGSVRAAGSCGRCPVARPSLRRPGRSRAPGAPHPRPTNHVA